jgi:hypothetical protein
MQFMIGYDPLDALILHSKAKLVGDLPVDVSTDTYCSFNVLLLAVAVTVTVVCIRRTKLGE